MTPYVGGDEFLSTITAASLEDIGYTIDMKSDAIDNGYKLPLPATFEQIAPNPKKYVEFTDFLKGSGSVGTAEAAVTAVDVKLDETADPKDATSNHPANSTSGCEAADFANFPKGNIALMQRGKCFFSTKADNAKAAGAVGIIIFNQGNTEARKSISPSTAADNAFPAIGIGFDLGKELATTAGLVVKISTPTHAQATIQTAALAPSYDEVVLQPIGTMAPDGKIRNFSGE
ncbi:MAG TPA: hypothetical protein ENK21_01780 [Trueperaceae bacterium]|nr:hypothetical protein [Trueperaceae bacterium]